MTHHVPKKKIPNPTEVKPQHEAKVLAHVAEQFGFTKTHEGHYGMKPGSASVTPTGVEGEDAVSFIRIHDPKVPAEDHGLDLS